MNHNLVSYVIKSCMVPYSFLDVQFGWLLMQVVEPENCAKVWNHMSDADNNIGALLAGKIVEFEIHLKALWLFWVVGLLKTRLHGEC